MESAIPDHLKCPRTRTKRVEDDYQPPYPAWVVRSPERLARVVMFYFGVQFNDADRSASADTAIAKMRAAFANNHGSVHDETSRYIDDRGYTTIVITGYWTRPETFTAWWDGSEIAAWWHSDDRINEGLGYFKEIAMPTFENFETLFSASDQLEGVGFAIGERSVSDIQEHGYWGSMRDRLPSSQTDALVASGALSLEKLEPLGKRVRVKGHDNIAMIRSGQDWSVTSGRERSLYIERMEPVLHEGMDFLEQSGLPIGCYVNRYMTNLDAAGQPVTRSFGLSYWHSLADMERWAEAHPTHLAIFGGFMTIVQELNFDVKLKLYHEVSILKERDQSYEYINCHPDTGLLRATAQEGAG